MSQPLLCAVCFGIDSMEQVRAANCLNSGSDTPPPSPVRLLSLLCLVSSSWSPPLVILFVSFSWSRLLGPLFLIF